MRELAVDLATRVRAERLRRNWTQAELAARAGISLASYRRFEQDGRIALERLLLVASALDALDAFATLFQPPSEFASLDEVEAAVAEGARPARGRARKGGGR